MAYFQTKNPILGKFWRVLQWKMFSIIYGHLVYFMFIWYNFSRFGMLYQENSGNPGLGPMLRLKKYFVRKYLQSRLKLQQFVHEKIFITFLYKKIAFFFSRSEHNWLLYIYIHIYDTSQLSDINAKHLHSMYERI
jgi:hypothetical protein